MGSFVAGNVGAVQSQNRSAVLRALLYDGPLGRSALGRRTQLVPSTITNLVSELMAHELVVELGPAGGPQRDRLGRPSIPLDINRRGGFVLGAYIGARRLTVTLGDLRATPLDWTHRPLPVDRMLPQFIDDLTQDVEMLLARHGVPRQRLFGLGIVAAGRVNPEQGILVELPRHPWQAVPLVTLLADRLPCPIVIDDSRRAMALAELVFGSAREVPSMILVHSGATIGCGLIINQQVYAGDHFDAGKLSHVVVEPDGARCSCGNRGCLETIATDDGIVRLARAAMLEAPASNLWTVCSGDSDALHRDHVLHAARAGDAAANVVIARAATALGRALANLVLTLDPSMVIVAGRISDAGDVLLTPVRQTIDAIVGRALGRSVDVRPSSFGVQELHMAGLTLALQRFVYSPSLTLPGDRAGNMASGRRAGVRSRP